KRFRARRLSSEDRMKTAAILVVGLGALAASSVACAKTVKSEYATIVNFDHYAGDETVFLEKNPPGCEQGFWLRPTHKGFTENERQIRDAVHMNARVQISGDDQQRWKQTEDNRCRLTSIKMEAVMQPLKDGETPIGETDSNDPALGGGPSA